MYSAYLDLNGEYTRFADKVTGVFAVCFDENSNVVLMSNEPLGGHLEPGESIDDALKRECLEEGGIELKRWKYFGYYEVVLKDDAPSEYKVKYPKLGYLLFFLAHGTKSMKPYGNDVKNPQVLSVAQLLKTKEITHKMLLEGIRLYPGYLIV
jgi:8-oxo-dGTP pyrophosphatase MutT (NUDIX family)